ncbi:DUF2284 domain-containing protein [Eubacterium limosum]|uniref:DUF2284 domain-containing protein n=1 Tax=Eubacterium limosum TaxID=1736 RepID=A0ABT5USL2_EUBLI|nr:DUF2284 domain-containing protein [Eubacterium limosum]MCB6569246.1 DUF2284 domain-containing protein [Eubacterium limosum]MDE1470945.1 DUF2284 domain-containing protein [Eubacterium limosum]
MDYIHKFSIGPVEMDKMLEEYHQLRKTRRYCAACPNYNKYWSCPDYAFDEALFLKEFKYMYLIAREYEIPREDRQKIFGIQPVAEYCKQVMQAMKVESWKDLLDLEAEFPGTLSLMPGNCHVCDISGEGCAKPKGQKCRHPELMRFSLESLGFDVDAICKYEIGVLLLWPKEGHLPEKLCAVMALMSNEKIPMDAIKAHFPDAKKSWLRFSDTAPEARNEVRPSVKRQESWIDNMKKQNLEKAEDPAYKPQKSWIGFKSEALDSGDYVKERPWREEEPEEVPAAPEETVALVEEMIEASAEPEPAVELETIVPEPSAQPETASEDEEDSKYKWLGFKRSVEEAEEEFKKRPIPKFNVPEEEEKTDESAAEATQTEMEAPAAETVPEIMETPMAEPEPEPVQPALEPQPEPAPEPPAPEPVEEEIELLDASSVANVLSAAIEIAKDVVGDDFIPEEPPVFNEPEPVSQTAAAEPTPAEEEDDSKYKWLGFKATNLDEDDGLKKGGWKKNY